MHKTLFILVLLFASILRLWNISALPSGLNWDEISHGYNAYSLLKTGKDQWGESWPIFNFRAYGDYPTTGNLYLTIPFVYTFGLNSFSIRLPAAIMGILFVLAVYFFVKTIVHSKTFALIAMFIAAITPWAIFPSRAVFQSNLSVVFLCVGTYLFFRGLRKPKSLIYSVLCLSLSTYTYHNARLIAPLILFTLTIFYYHELKKILTKQKFILYTSIGIILLLLLPNTINLFSPNSLARNRWVGIINPNSINLINESRRVFEGPQFLNIALNNKVVYFAKTFTLNYLNLLNPIPLFFKGSANYQFNPPNTGLLLSIFLPFFYIGFFKLLSRTLTDSKSLLIIILFLISLLPAALTTGDYPSIRASSALHFYILFIVFGISYSLKLLRTPTLFLIVGISLLQLLSYGKSYLSYTKEFSSAWQYGYKEVIDYLKPNLDKYDQIVFTKKYGEPHEFVLFHTPIDPLQFQSDPNLKWDFHADWYWVDAFGKYKFVNDWDIKNFSYSPKTLLVTSPGNYPSGFKPLHTISFQNGEPAFAVLSND